MTAPLSRKPLSNVEYLLSEIRLARAHAHLWVNTLDTIGTALKAGLITPELAVAELHACQFFQPIVDALDASLVTLDRAGEALEDLRRQMAYDPAELESVEERLFALRAAARKHQATCDELPAILEKYQGDLDTLQSGESRLKALELSLIHI